LLTAVAHITPEKFYVEACDDGADDVLIIDRVSTEVTLSVKKDIPPSAVTRPIFGILGTIHLVAGKKNEITTLVTKSFCFYLFEKKFDLSKKYF
uniref:Uncharacterized protein n=1 Tax=Capra hircus TaxID=9925 RepID=A0A8C2SI51_CAPHI